MLFRSLSQKKLEILRGVSKYIAKISRWQYVIPARNPIIRNATKSVKYLQNYDQWKASAHEAIFADAMVDYKLSKNNFFVDQDGNQILDLSMQGGMLALGYNPDALIDAHAKRSFDKYLAQTPNLAEYPPHDYSDFIRTEIMPIAPEGLSEVQLTDGIGGLANEAAIKAALLKYAESRGGLSEIDWDNFASADLSNSSELLQNKVCVLGFENSSHSRTLAGNSLSSLYQNSTQSKFNWPVGPTPNTKYPYQKHKEYNLLHEAECLKITRSIIEEKEASGCPVGAMIVEPITFLSH
jgi:4-aminobutyrate aminotransferase/(S)-3-amino-2-methylpropionate transaminase